MAYIKNGQKKTYVSTFRLDLKSSADLQTPVSLSREKENESAITVKPLRNRKEGCLKSETANTKKDQRSIDLEIRPKQESYRKIIDIVQKKGVSIKRACNNSDAVVQFLDRQSQVEVCAGETAQLHCRFSSSEPVASCWIHNREKVVLEGPRTSVKNTNNSSTLILSKVLPADAGSYSLFVRNRGGTAHWTVTLCVIDHPDPPASCPFVSQLTRSSLVLSWSGPSYDGGSVVTSYVVELQSLDQTLPRNWTQLTNQCQNTSYPVHSGLDPQGEYRFRVRACNAAGISDPSEETDIVKMETAGEPQQEVTQYVDVVIDTKHKVRDHYHVYEKLGKGKFGEVFRLTHKETGRVCAGKFYRGRISKEKEAARKEIKLMNELHHPKLVQCYAAYDTLSEMVMILEYIGGGELFERIVDEHFEHTEPTCVNYMRQILEGIQYMHRKRIVHLDLKPENILCVNSTGTLIKIIDFGLASKMESGKPLMVLHGTPEFVAPEVISYEPVDLATDMWSIGIICYILLSGESPFQGSSDAETLALVTAAQWEFDSESFDDISEEAQDFISGLLQKEKRARLSCEKALAHPWITSFDDSDPRTTKSLNKDKMRRFLAMQKWKKTGKALLALKRMAHRPSKSDEPHSPANFVDESGLGKDALHAVESLEKQLRSEPRFQHALHDISETSGMTVHLACTIHGYPDPEVVWLFDEEPLEKTERVHMNYEKDGVCTLTLDHIQPKDSGIYKCCASNSLGHALCSAKLTVER